MKNNKCIALFSGGLDSILAVKLMEKLGFEVIPIFFETPFFTAQSAIKAAKENCINLRVINVYDEYIKVLLNPRYGYGKNMNPCVDCHGFMFRKAGEMLEELKADFLISGEVLGQRPMSQRKDAMNAVGKLSKVKDLLVRPLSQKLLADTLPVREGWVDKAELLDIQGRGRHRQMELVKEFGIKNYQSPAGGCKLTEIKYSVRLKDLIEYDQLSRDNIKYLRYGRHFRLNDKTKLVVGRSKSDNENIAAFIKDEIVIKSVDIHGPLGVIIKEDKLDEKEIALAAGIILRYNNSVSGKCEVSWGKNFSLNNIVVVEKLDNDDVERLMIK